MPQQGSGRLGDEFQVSCRAVAGTGLKPAQADPRSGPSRPVPCAGKSPAAARASVPPCAAGDWGTCSLGTPPLRQREQVAARVVGGRE